MSFWASAKRAWQLGQEYSGAWSAARDALVSGKPVVEVVRAFADATHNELDDAAVQHLTRGIEAAVEAAQTAALVLGRAAAWVEENEPKVLDAVAHVGTLVERHGPRLARAAARAGALATAAALRLDALRR